MNYGPYPGRIVGLHDGDTLSIDLDLGFGIIFNAHDLNGKPVNSCRIYGINAPELSTEAGKKALAYAESLVKPGDKATAVSHGWDAYGGRFDGTITLSDGSDFATKMVESGNAVWKSYK